MVGRAVALSVVDRAQPATQVWLGAMNALSAQYSDVDRTQLLRGDAMLLLGALCEASARCEFDWRAARES